VIRTAVLLGISGSGKTTQAERLRSDGWEVLTAGDLILDLAEADPTVARKYQRGELVPDTLLFPAVRDRLSGLKADQVVLDGFPRAVSQAKWLDGTEWSPAQVVLLVVSPQEAVRRLSQRGRADDTPEVFERKKKVFEREVMPVAAYYRERGLLCEIDGEGSVEEVAVRVREVLGD
jgi:adenylate kinase